MAASNYNGYPISRTLVPLLILSLPIAAMIAWILYQKKAVLNPQTPSAYEEVSFGDESWPVFRGNAELTGLAKGNLPEMLKPAWKFQAEGEIVAAPVIAADTAYVSSLDKHLYAVDLQTGKEKWRFEADDELLASPLYFENTVYVGSNSGTLYAVDAETGQAKWHFGDAGEISGSANIAQAPAGGQTLIVFGSYDNNLYCLTRDGKLGYQYPADNYINGAVAVADTTVFFGSCDAKLYQVRIGDPNATQALDTGSYVAANPAIDDGVAYVGNYEGKFLAVDITTQKILWSYDKTEDAFFSSPAVDETVVIVGCRNKKLYCFDKQSGQVRWTFLAGDNFDSSPVICGDKVVVGNDDGRLYIVGIQTGKEVFSYTLGGPVRSSAAIAQNTLLIGNDNGILYAFVAK